MSERKQLSSANRKPRVRFELHSRGAFEAVERDVMFASHSLGWELVALTTVIKSPENVKQITAAEA